MLPSPSALQHRQVEAAGGLGDVAERVRARVAVVGRVGQLARAAGVDDDDEGALHGCDRAARCSAHLGARVRVEVDVACRRSAERWV